MSMMKKNGDNLSKLRKNNQYFDMENYKDVTSYGDFLGQTLIQPIILGINMHICYVITDHEYYNVKIKFTQS